MGAQDLMLLYDAARGRPSSPLPAITPAFEELEKRLMDTFHCRPSPMRASLRGSLFRYAGVGYGYTVGLGPGAIGAIEQASLHLRIPLDVTLLGLVVCGAVCADGTDFFDLTLYTPMRDGLAEAMYVGLFSDWRDLHVNVDFNLATVLGTILQINYKIQHRQWSVFNALRKPERTVVNIQPLDFEQRGGFKNLGENMWRGGDQLGAKEKREMRMEWTQQPGTFVIEEQDEGTWWILISAGYDQRPAPWMRRFVASFERALKALLFDPLAVVHHEMPDDYTLLRRALEPQPLVG